jgi:type IV secretion system protein VirD4
MALFRPSEEVIGSPALDAFYIGRYWEEASGFAAPRIGPKMQMPGTEPIVVIGRNRSGKDAGIGNYNALRLKGRSWWMYDPRGEGAAISGAYRATLGPTYMINPDGLHADRPGYEDLRSHGRNPLLSVDWNRRFFDDVARIAAAWMRIPVHGDPHWMHRARAVVRSLCMFEIQRAAIERRAPSIANVRAMLTEADEFDPKTAKPLKGLAATALRIIAEGGPQAGSLISQMVSSNDETHGVRATADGATEWMLSPIMATDMGVAGGVDFRELGERPCSCYVILPHDMVETHSAFVREAISSALAALQRPTNTICTFWVNEFATLGKSEAIESALGLVAGNGIQLVFVVQSLTQLVLHYGRDAWENFMGQAGCVILIGPPGDKFTADYLSSRSGETTILQPSSSTSLNQGAVGLSNGEGYTRRQYLTPHDLYGLQPGFGYVWVAGLSNAIPAYFPPYFDVEQLARRARANPFYRG